ncbi:Stk1 family PASTA domain-containing Ser/Thr kinase [Calidifontibacter terrae]
MSASSEASIVGRVIDGRYRVVRHLADGGMGSVFVALDERLDREIALKVMRADLTHDEAFVARFRREARSAARLDHPNVVAVTDQGSDAHYAFLAMELVNGHTLRQVIRARAPMPAEDALSLMDPILEGLAAAHRAGLVHRDVKPENVLIRDDGVVKVTDFGLARAVTTSTLTGDSDILLGTASYLSPEQVEFGTADARTDVYAAGLLLFELLTGQKAFPGDSPIHVAYQHVHGRVPVPSEEVDGVPPEVDALVADATAKDPDDRPANAADLLIALRSTSRALGHPVITKPVAALNEAEAARPAGRRPTSRRPSRATDGSHTTQIGSTTDPLVGHAPSAPDGRRRWSRLLVLAAVLLLVCAGGGGWLFTGGPLGSTTVPTVRGSQQGAALRRINSADLHAKVKQTFSETVPSGQVISTAPTGGASTRKNSTITLTVSKGPERYTVPAVLRSPLAAAKTKITSNSMRVGTVTQAYDESIPTGSVVSTTPAVGASVKKNSPVAIVVSKGKQPVPLPDVSGKSEADATSTLNGLGLTVNTAPEQFSDTVAAGSVISTTPPTGTVLHKGDSVTVIVSKGPEMVMVPNVVDLKSGAAKSKLEALGFTVKFDRFFGGVFDTVRGQSLKSGTSVRKGSTITLSIV